MLTIREPISLKTQRPIQSVRQDLAERMRANYGLMRLPIRKEELLHITSEPPEIYFAEGENLQIFTNIKNENQQEIRLDVINNLINRIMVSQTDNFTYQDTVYISSVLRKLGIRDEKTFMKQVFQLQNEHKETHRLLKKYEDNQEILQMLFTQEQEQRQKEDKKPEIMTAEEQRYYIHDEIFKRLDTGRIYQDMRTYTKSWQHDSRQIFRNEFTVGEQVAMVKNFHLHNLKQKIMQMDAPLVYFHNNQYEFLQENLEEVNETLEERISAAILLNVMNQSFSLRQQQIEENSHNWYSVAGALFQTAENTWKRYEANLVENKRVSNQMTQMLDEVNEVKRQEGDVISHITQEFHRLNQEWKSNTELKQQQLQQNRVQQTSINEVNMQGGSYYLTQEEAELQYLQQMEEAEEKEEPAMITAEQLQRQLEVFNQKNYENYQKLTELERNQPRLKERKLDRRKAQQDALRALENPGEVLMEFITTEVHDPVLERQKQVETQIYELFSDETKEIYRQFLQQSPIHQTTFLQHVMAQPEESELRQEVVHAIEQIQQHELVQRMEQQIESRTERMQPVVTQKVNQEIRRQMTSLQELQKADVYQQWIHPAEIRWKKDVQKETQIMQQAGEERERLLFQREQVQQAAEENIRTDIAEVMEKQTLIHPSAVQETEEILPETTERTILHQQEQQLTEIRQNMENRLRTEQRENILETRELHREIRSSEAELVHETQEQFVLEENRDRIYMEHQEQQLTEVRRNIEKQLRIDQQENLLETQELQREIQSHDIELVHEMRDQFVTEEKQDHVYIQQQEQQLTEIRQNIEMQIKRQQMERISEVSANQRDVQFRRVDIVHKTEEQLVTEELLETIRTQQQSVRKEERREETTLRQNQINQMVVQDTINRTQMNQIQNIDELVQQTVKKQMNHLSDQVYGKIEKKLATERKRRGY